MSIKNFRINKAQAHRLSSMGYNSEECEIVINCESYDRDEGTFECAMQVKESVHDSVWTAADPYMNEDRWVFFTMNNDGTVDLHEPEES